MNKSTKQILSLIFHLIVLGSMVLIHDVGKLIAVKVGIIEQVEDKKSDKQPDKKADKKSYSY